MVFLQIRSPRAVPYSSDITQEHPTISVCTGKKNMPAGLQLSVHSDTWLPFPLVSVHAAKCLLPGSNSNPGLTGSNSAPRANTFIYKVIGGGIWESIRALFDIDLAGISQLCCLYFQGRSLVNKRWWVQQALAGSLLNYCWCRSACMSCRRVSGDKNERSGSNIEIFLILKWKHERSGDRRQWQRSWKAF